MVFNKGSELDKQIYKEGESTWGCKSGVLDVEDVKELLRQICGKAIVKQGASDYVLYGNDMVKFIENKSGFVLSGANDE